MTYINVREQARRYREILNYFKHWPYSPYTDIEYEALTNFIRNTIKTGEGKEGQG